MCVQTPLQSLCLRVTVITGCSPACQFLPPCAAATAPAALRPAPPLERPAAAKASPLETHSPGSVLHDPLHFGIAAPIHPPTALSRSPLQARRSLTPLCSPSRSRDRSCRPFALHDHGTNREIERPVELPIELCASPGPGKKPFPVADHASHLLAPGWLLLGYLPRHVLLI